MSIARRNAYAGSVLDLTSKDEGRISRRSKIVKNRVTTTTVVAKSDSEECCSVLLLVVLVVLVLRSLVLR